METSSQVSILGTGSVKVNTTTPSLVAFDNAIVSMETLSTFASVVDLWLSLVVALVGVVCNLLALIVFYRMGLRESSVNVTMSTITFWDLLRSLCGTLYRLHGPMAWFSPTLSRNWQNIAVTNIVYLNIISGNVSYVIGGYVALERCLCVSAPFLVKRLVTPAVTAVVCTLLSFIVFFTLFPIMLTLEYKWVDTGQIGGPVVIYQFTSFYKVYGPRFMELYQSLSLFYPIISLAVMSISTAVISFNLRLSSKFRNKLTSSAAKTRETLDSREGSKTKEGQVIKMLLVVIVSHIVVLVPRVVHYVAEIFEPEYYLLKHYNNVFWLVVYFLFFLDFVNSSIGFFIFYVMSSKFRTTFQSMFRATACSRGQS